MTRRPSAIIPLTPLPDLVVLQGRLTLRRLQLEMRMTERLREDECRRALRAEWPKMRTCPDDDPCYFEAPCEHCSRWESLQVLNHRINRRAGIRP